MIRKLWNSYLSCTRKPMRQALFFDFEKMHLILKQDNLLNFTRELAVYRYRTKYKGLWVKCENVLN